MEAIDIPEKRRSDPTYYDAASPNKIDGGTAVALYRLLEKR
jgi:hypothetical protein